MKSRTSGVLMHITSLPGEFGIGTFGREAYNFVDFLDETKQTYWQLLPLTTTSYGDSPYQSFSAVAGNTNLIDFTLLAEQGLLDKDDYIDVNFGSNVEDIDYGLLFEVRRPILDKAVSKFLSIQDNITKLNDFRDKNRNWLVDYAEYMAIKEHFNHAALQKWPDLRAKNRDFNTLERYRDTLKNVILYYEVTQYFFFEQYLNLKKYANSKGIKIIGDMPIYVSADSVEMWTMPHLFKVDSNNEPLAVAGCPADDFSPEGQLWGNPLYNWEKHKETSYEWWIYRIEESFKIYDVLRIDHFKGFSDYWQIDRNSQSAKYGSWQEGPGIELFEKIKERLGNLPIIAENLGFIDAKAEKLLEDSGYPGMKILQFAFGGEDSFDLPHNYTANSVAYTGTHDNDVINGWYEEQSEETKKYVDKYINRHKDEPITKAMLRTLYSSVSNTAIATMQDLLDKDKSSRMNLPSTVGQNWRWRMKKEDLTQDKKEFLKEITILYKRER
ncbi:4-alpha-glucanotransferase [Gemella sp. GH3]|nr:4-alpha-glucanotransferase [Gemella sp. GH3.1]NYS50737.1 4-alpha-glucanotransferase [Gemella sp. GH3]